MNYGIPKGSLQFIGRDFAAIMLYSLGGVYPASHVQAVQDAFPFQGTRDKGASIRKRQCSAGSENGLRFDRVWFQARGPEAHGSFNYSYGPNPCRASDLWPGKYDPKHGNLPLAAFAMDSNLIALCSQLVSIANRIRSAMYRHHYISPLNACCCG